MDILAQDFELPEQTQILCIDGPPACDLAERYFDESLQEKATNKLRNTPVKVFLLDELGIFYVTVTVRQLLTKEVGVQSGLILDPGQLQGFIASKIMETGDFAVARPSRFPPTSKTLKKYLKGKQPSEGLNIVYCRLRERGDWGSDWHDAALNPF